MRGINGGKKAYGVTGTPRRFPPRRPAPPEGRHAPRHIPDNFFVGARTARHRYRMEKIYAKSY
ncbi:MAG TPA: hypothetical protein VNI02_11910 [Blastocatellia bacterium]|nr:hypothetical protein [Blastocatellia bacterium]